MITRSGTTVRQHAVRFKKGADVRRVLEYDEDDWIGDDLNTNNAVCNGGSHSPLNGICSKGILVNSSSPVTQQSIGLTTTHQDSPVVTAVDTTMQYDITERNGSSWVWDAMLFTIVTLSCYTSVLVLYSLWGHRLYLALTTLCIILFSYNVTYFDSTKPGVMPPSPVSPIIYKKMSGHTYHLTYMMSLINGIVFLLVEPYIRGIIVPPV